MLASLSLLPTPYSLLPLLELMGYFWQPELEMPSGFDEFSVSFVVVGNRL